MKARYTILGMVALGMSACVVAGENAFSYGHGYIIAGGDMSYTFSEGLTTPKGVQYDPSGQTIDVGAIDLIVDTVEHCTGVAINRAELRIKVPNDWLFSYDHSQEVLNSEAPESGCDAKGQNGVPAVCRWRALLTDDRIVVATPSLYLLPDALTRYATGSNDPWNDPHLAVCASPLTAPLSGLTPTK